MSSSMAWIYLLIAGGMEIGWALSLKRSQGFSHPWSSLLTILLIGISTLFLGLAVRKIPIGTAYAIWTGIGAAGTVVAGIMLFHESRDFYRIFCVAMIIGGVVGLKFARG